jgi:hypothetical protein
MTTTDSTLDDLFAELPSGPLYRNIRNALVRNNITDVDRLRTVSREQLAAMSPMFTPGVIAKFDERIRALSEHGLGSDNSNYGFQRCVGVYGRFDQLTPLAMAQFHSDWLPQPLLDIVLRYAPDTRMRDLDGWDEDELRDLLDLIVVHSNSYPPTERLYHNTFVTEFIGGLEKLGMRFTNRTYQPTHPAFAVA